MQVAPFTPCPGGFVTTRPLPDGRTLIEGWVLTLQPYDSDEPRHEAAYHWVAATGEEVADTVAEFAGWLGALLGA